jgi:succinate-acetate transporter protein
MEHVVQRHRAVHPSTQSRGTNDAAPAIADPAPLGLAALALPLFALSLINLGLVKATAMPVVFATLLFYGGLGQAAVAIWEVRRNNTFGVVAFGTFGAFNLAAWYFLTEQLPGIPAADHPTALALFMGIWAIPAALLWIASFRTTRVVNTIFALATVLLTVAAIGNGTGDETVTKVGAVIGIALACVAWYGCLSALTGGRIGPLRLPDPHLGSRS